MKRVYKVTYNGTRRYNTYGTKKAALDQARYAVSIGNMKSCVFRRLPSGRWHTVTCLSRRRSR